MHAEVDALISISAASLYTEGPTCTPTFSGGGQQTPWFYAKGLRHPTAGAALAAGNSFVPNNINLGGEQHAPFMLLTGPNMGGKSTLLRQVCLAVILAQVYCSSLCLSGSLISFTGLQIYYMGILVATFQLHNY